MIWYIHSLFIQIMVSFPSSLLSFSFSPFIWLPETPFIVIDSQRRGSGGGRRRGRGGGGGRKEGRGRRWRRKEDWRCGRERFSFGYALWDLKEEPIVLFYLFPQIEQFSFHALALFPLIIGEMRNRGDGGTIYIVATYCMSWRRMKAVLWYLEVMSERYDCNSILTPL